MYTYVHIHTHTYIHTYIHIYIYLTVPPFWENLKQVFARVYNTFPSLLYVRTPALPRFASRSVTMRGGPHPRVLDFVNTQPDTFPPWEGLRPLGGGYAETVDLFGPPPLGRVLGALWALCSLFFALGHVLHASRAFLGQSYAMFNDF